MFIDYYEVLGIAETATSSEIKAAYRRQTLKWHPDRNHNQDTTSRMQQIIEAYQILNNNEDRQRYDAEYQKYKAYQRQKEQFDQQQKNQQYSEPEKDQKETRPAYNDYQVHDDVLNDRMNSAKKQAADLAKQSIEDLVGMIQAGAKAAGKEVVSMLGCIVMAGIIILILSIFVRACNYSSQPISYNDKAAHPIESPKKITPAAIPIDTFENEKSYNVFVLKDVGYISIPASMELQSGAYKKVVADGLKTLGRKYHFFVSDDRVVFQQEGLNTLSEKGFSLYARVIIETEFGYFDDYPKQTDDFSLTPSASTRINSSLRQQVSEGLKGTGLYIVEWKGVSTVKVNNSVALKIAFVRRLNDNPNVYVEQYQFYNNDRMHSVTLSYRQQDSLVWKPLFAKTISSFHLTNIK